jgi:hypothetical protein
MTLPRHRQSPMRGIAASGPADSPRVRKAISATGVAANPVLTPSAATGGPADSTSTPTVTASGFHARARTRLRPIVRDDGREIVLGMYDAGRLVAEIALSPLRSIAIAGELIDAAGRHLQRAADDGATAARWHRGQRTARTLAGLQNGNRAIAALRNQFFGDLGITKAAEEIAAEGRRYEAAGWRFDKQRPIAEIGDERRQLLAQVLHGRSRFPGARRIRGLIWEMNSTAIHFPNSPASGEHEDRDFG